MDPGQQWATVHAVPIKPRLIPLPLHPSLWGVRLHLYTDEGGGEEVGERQRDRERERERESEWEGEPRCPSKHP